jgi:nucleoside 2-deoxyribosyltransferase
MKIFIICPVREVTPEEKEIIAKHVFELEADGHKVHWPQRDTDQNDPNGVYICKQNRDAILKADEIHIYWNGKSAGSLFDFGMTFALRKPIKLINQINKTENKSFENVLKTLVGED